MVWKKKWCAGAGGASLLLIISVGLILVAYLDHTEEEQEENPAVLVVTSHGTVKGKHIFTRKGREILSFTGIPYVAPPVEDFRFRIPQPLKKWKGILEATKNPPKCIQRNFYLQEEVITGQEDCLYINVYTPYIKGHHLLDVMVWIHGGGWFAGTGSEQDPSYLLDRNVVLVTFNYRLGVLGFLSTGDATCPGNNGLKDQVAALRWVQNNIAAFGGNPGSVTIFGQSAGGASVHYLMLSPLATGLFHRAISHSGTAFCPWALASHESAMNKTEKLASLLDCPTSSSSVLLDCLRKKSAEDIVATDKAFTEWIYHPMIPFKPVVETGRDAFLPASPMELARNLGHSVPWMTGLTSQEGALVVSRIVKESLLSDLDDNFSDVAAITLFYSEASVDKLETSKLIKEFYLGDRNITNSSSLSIVDIYTDGWFLHGEDKAVKIQSQVSSEPVYYYYFTYRGSRSFSTIFGDASQDYGVSHSDDMLYLFPADKTFPNSPPTEEDERMTDLITTLWTNFAHNGDPNPPPDKSVRWERVSTPSDSEYLQIGKEGLQMKRGLLKKRVQFWDSLQALFTEMKNDKK